MTAVFGELGHLGSVSGGRGTEIAAHVMAGHVVGIDAAVLQGPPRHPQRHPLLGIHRDGLTRRDPEEFRVECRCTGEESAAVMDLFEAVAP